jgi:hypothetical protein
LLLFWQGGEKETESAIVSGQRFELALAAAKEEKREKISGVPRSSPIPFFLPPFPLAKDRYGVKGVAAAAAAAQSLPPLWLPPPPPSLVPSI